MEPLLKEVQVYESGELKTCIVSRLGIGIINTDYGKFWEYIFTINDEWQNYNVIVKAGIDGENLNPIFLNSNSKKTLILRTDSGCLTGQLFGDRTCDCLDQLQLALKTINKQGEGIVVNIPNQDGRGMGLDFKLGTLWLQDQLGVDTVESAYMLADTVNIDKRTYAGVVAILKYFNIDTDTSINLASNNPAKEKIFLENGYHLSNTIPMVIKANKHTQKHLSAKRLYLGHKHIGN